MNAPSVNGNTQDPNVTLQETWSLNINCSILDMKTSLVCYEFGYWQNLIPSWYYNLLLNTNGWKHTTLIHPKLNHSGFLMYGASCNGGRLSHITLVERGKYGLKAWEWNLTYFRV
jgi:hypothetical protein